MKVSNSACFSAIARRSNSEVSVCGKSPVEVRRAHCHLSLRERPESHNAEFNDAFAHAEKFAHKIFIRLESFIVEKRTAQNDVAENLLNAGFFPYALKTLSLPDSMPG